MGDITIFYNLQVFVEKDMQIYTSLLIILTEGKRFRQAINSICVGKLLKKRRNRNFGVCRIANGNEDVPRGRLCQSAVNHPSITI